MKIEDLGIVVRWQYNEEILPKSGKKTISTTCVILNSQTEEVLGTGITYTSPKDLYNRETGRRYALNKCLLSTTLTKVERSKVWEVYRTLPKQPRWKPKAK